MARGTLDWFVLAGAIVLGIAFLAGQWRYGRIRGATAALEVQQREIENQELSDALVAAAKRSTSVWPRAIASGSRSMPSTVQSAASRMALL